MSLVENVKTCFRNHNRFVEVLRQIANGRDPADRARQMARDVLRECGIREEQE